MKELYDMTEIWTCLGYSSEVFKVKPSKLVSMAYSRMPIFSW
jgi:hypothetical protein